MAVEIEERTSKREDVYVKDIQLIRYEVKTREELKITAGFRVACSCRRTG